MSSILKALKKIEDGSGTQENQPSLLHKINTRKAVTGRLKKRWYLSKVFSYATATVLILSAGVLLLTLKPGIVSNIFSKKGSNSNIEGDGNKVFRAKIDPANTLQKNNTPVAQTNRPVKNRSSSSSQKTTKSDVAAARVPLKNDPKKIAKRTPVSQNQKLPPSSPVKNKIVKDTKSATMPPAAKIPSPKPAKKSKTANQVVRKESSGDKYSNVDRFSGSKLKLQAIAWSQDPAGRLAVINNRILREGDSVDGYDLTKIRKDDVVLNGGGKSWRLEFGLKR